LPRGSIIFVGPAFFARGFAASEDRSARKSTDLKVGHYDRKNGGINPACGTPAAVECWKGKLRRG
jgi:hypothetical protein